MPIALVPNPDKADGQTSSIQTLTGSFDNPNGNIEPPNKAIGAEYYKDQATPVVKWLWSVTSQNWFTE